MADPEEYSRIARASSRVLLASVLGILALVVMGVIAMVVAAARGLPFAF